MRDKDSFNRKKRYAWQFLQKISPTFFSLIDKKEMEIFCREFGRIFDSGRCSSTNTLVDYVLKTCLLCFLWYLSCYLMYRSMSILISSEIIILYSIRVTLRQVLGWIFLHEQFIGNKVCLDFFWLVEMTRDEFHLKKNLDHCTYSWIICVTFSCSSWWISF